MRLTRRSTVLSLATVAILGLTACAGEDTTTPAATSTEQSTETATDEATNEASDAGADDLTPENFTERTVAAQLAAGSMTMEIVVAAAGTTMDMSGDVVIRDGQQQVAMTMEIPGVGDLEIRVVDGIYYMNLGEMSQGKFLAFDPSDESNPLASEFGGLSDQMDPTQSVEDLDGAIASIEKVGEPVDVNGVQAQQYEVVVDTTKVSGTTAEQFGQSAEAGVELPEEVVYQYWIDAEDRVQKVTSEVLGASTEVTFTNWGADFDIVAPDEDEILEDMPF